MAVVSFGDFTCYFRHAFFGRDAGSKEILRHGETETITWRAAPGLTQWVANNFEVLNLGPKPPTMDRKVDEGNRPLWTPLLTPIWNDCLVGLPIEPMSFDEVWNSSRRNNGNSFLTLLRQKN